VHYKFAVPASSLHRQRHRTLVVHDVVVHSLEAHLTRAHADSYWLSSEIGETVEAYSVLFPRVLMLVLPCPSCLLESVDAA